MWIYIVSTVLVIIASLCYFKRDAWENRYSILLLIGSVSFIATLTTNYIIRGNLDTYMVESTIYSEIHPHSLHDTLVCDTTDFIFYDWDIYIRSDGLFRPDKNDSLHQTKRFAVFYTYDGENRVTFYRSEKRRIRYLLDKIYLQPSASDTTAYLIRRIMRYENNIYTAGFSMPDKDDIKILYIPPSEYNAIPDSLLRELPF